MSELREHYEREAKRIDADYRRQAERVQADARLSDVGKREELARLNGERLAEVAQLQAQAAAALELAQVGAADDIRRGRERAFADKRRTLGDGVIYSLYSRRIERLGGAEIAAWLRVASAGFERLLLRELALLTLGERERSGAATVDDDTALAQLRAEPDELAALDERVQAMADTAWLADLDYAAYRARIGQTFGVRADLVDAEQG